MVTVFCPLTTTGMGELVIQITGESKFVLESRVNPEKLVGHVTMTLVLKCVMASCNTGNEMLKTVP